MSQRIVYEVCYHCDCYIFEDDHRMVLFRDGRGVPTYICEDCEQKMAQAHGVGDCHVKNT